MAQPPESGFDERIEEWLPPVGDTSFRIWASPLLPSFGIVWARDHIHEYPAHLHDCVELIWMHSGRATINCRNKSYDLRAGDMCMVAPNELHSTHIPPSARCTFTILHVPSTLYWPLVYEHARRGRRSVLEPVRVLRTINIGVSLSSLVEALVRSHASEEICAQFSNMLEAAMLTEHKFATIGSDKAFWHPAVLHARVTMSDCSEEALNVRDMAIEVGLNMRYFISLFKDGTGLSPHQYQIALRVERARNLIQELKSPLCDVAICAGFSDQSHLNRHFKRSYGYTPGTFRQILNPI